MSPHALNPDFYSYQPEKTLLLKGMHDQIKLTGIISLLSYNISNHRNDILFSGSTHTQKGDDYITGGSLEVSLTIFQSLYLFVSLYLRWVSSRQYTVGSFFFNPILQSLLQIGIFTLNMTVHRAGFKSTILLFVLYLFHLFFVLFHLKKIFLNIAISPQYALYFSASLHSR